MIEDNSTGAGKGPYKIPPHHLFPSINVFKTKELQLHYLVDRPVTYPLPPDSAESDSSLSIGQSGETC